MKFNFDTTSTEYYAEENMILVKNQKWDPDGDNGRGDSIGRNFYGYLTYKDNRFINGVNNCWEKVELDNGKYYYQGYRNPKHKRENINTLSRDHVLYTMLLYKEYGYSDEQMKEFVTNLKWKISDFANFTIDLWLFGRALAGMKWAGVLYGIISFFNSIFVLLANKTIYLIGGFKNEVPQDEYVNLRSDEISKWQLTLRKFLYPMYSAVQGGFSLSYLKNNMFTKLLRWVKSGQVLNENFVAQMIYNCKRQPTKEQAFGYRYMKGGRWSTTLNTANDRDIFILEDKYPKEESDILLKENVLDVDMVRKMYNDKLFLK